MDVRIFKVGRPPYFHKSAIAIYFYPGILGDEGEVKFDDVIAASHIYNEPLCPFMPPHGALLAVFQYNYPIIFPAAVQAKTKFMPVFLHRKGIAQQLENFID
jgi:hypothetical protein